MPIITLEELRERAKGEEVEIPDWTPDQTIVVRLRRLDLTAPEIGLMGRMKAFPNALKAKAIKGSAPGKLMEEMDPEAMDSMMEMFTTVARLALLEPTYEQIVETGLVLTMEQKMAIFGWQQGEIDALEPFRGQSGAVPGAGPDG